VNADISNILVYSYA